MSVAGSACLLFAISLLYGATGTVSFTDLSEIAPSALKVIIVLIVAGFGVKAVIFPFHFWAPDVYQSSDPPTAALFASVLSKVGIFGLARILWLIFPFTAWAPSLAVLALISATFGNLMALVEKDLKRLFAFASIAHLSFIAFAISLSTREGVVAGLFHTLNHTIVMAALFFCLGTFTSVNLTGLGTVPQTYRSLFLIAALAASGIPPFNIFLSELLILLATIGRGWLGFSAVLLCNLFLALAVFLRVVGHIFSAPIMRVKTNPWTIIPTLTLTIAICGLGVWPGPILDVLEEVAMESLLLT
jgi:formate hydrogenlyase subunit 3/multisubunit Na+/H+ antiporter MnhD subunit